MFILRPIIIGLYKNSKIFLLRCDSWSAKNIVPDILDIAPPELLGVKYQNAEVNGSVIPAKSTKYRPTITWNVKGQGHYYTLVMSDIDAPSRKKPVLREWHHWLVGNIPDTDFNKGQELTEYIGAGPPKGTGLHRFAFVLYKQPTIINFPNYKITKKEYKGRPKFSSRHFMMKHNLELYAGNFFEAEYDHFVDELHKQINLSEYLDITKGKYF